MPVSSGMDDSILVSPVRLPIIVVLAMYDEADFSFLKKELEMSDGNLGANLKKLEDGGYITSKKMFVSRKPKTIYKISATGLKRLKEFIGLIKGVERAMQQDTEKSDCDA